MTAKPGRPVTFDRQVVPLALERHERGELWKAIATDLGVCEGTLKARASEYRRVSAAYKTPVTPPKAPTSCLRPSKTREGTPAIDSVRGEPDGPEPVLFDAAGHHIVPSDRPGPPAWIHADGPIRDCPVVSAFIELRRLPETHPDHLEWWRRRHAIAFEQGCPTEDPLSERREGPTGGDA